jgi:hypothetical protein
VQRTPKNWNFGSPKAQTHEYVRKVKNKYSVSAKLG